MKTLVLPSPPLISDNYYEVKLPPIDISNNHINENNIKKLFILSKNKIKKTLEEHIQELPDELTRYIFDYVKIFLWHEEFIMDLKSATSRRLDIYQILPWIPRILSNKNFTHYCIINDKFFKKVWETEKKNNKKQFKLMKRGNSFAQSLLMYHYH